jgi:predicted HD superfamily hydrolase involved in NAD metabolism
MELSQRFAVNQDECRIAALAHDMDREATQTELLEAIDTYGIPVTDVERNNPKMLHGPVAAWELEHRYGVESPGVLTAVRHHTLGHPDMGPVGWILFVADYTEPGRIGLSTDDRERIFSHRSLPAMACAVVVHSRERYGRLERPTESMYQHLVKKEKDGAFG